MKKRKTKKKVGTIKTSRVAGKKERRKEGKEKEKKEKEKRRRRKGNGTSRGGIHF